MTNILLCTYSVNTTLPNILVKTNNPSSKSWTSLSYNVLHVLDREEDNKSLVFDSNKNKVGVCDIIIGVYYACIWDS